MSTLPLSPEQRAQKWATITKAAGVLVVGFVLAPYIFTAITGLIGLLAAGAVMAITWTVLPMLGDAAKNLRLRLIKAEAARNPIETLEGEYLRRSQLLNERKTKIETLAAKTQGFGSKLVQFKRDYPTEAEQFQQIYDKMVLLLKRSREQWVVAEKQMRAFDGEITKAKAKWAMALAAADLRADAGKVEAEFLAKLKVECSFDTIETGMNLAFSQLDTLLMESEAVEINVTPAKAALPAPSTTAIPVEALDSTKARAR